MPVQRSLLSDTFADQERGGVGDGGVILLGMPRGCSDPLEPFLEPLDGFEGAVGVDERPDDTDKVSMAKRSVVDGAGTPALRNRQPRQPQVKLDGPEERERLQQPFFVR